MDRRGPVGRRKTVEKLLPPGLHPGGGASPRVTFTLGGDRRGANERVRGPPGYVLPHLAGINRPARAVLGRREAETICGSQLGERKGGGEKGVFDRRMPASAYEAEGLPITGRLVRRYRAG